MDPHLQNLHDYLHALAPLEPSEWSTIRAEVGRRRLRAGEVWLHAGDDAVVVAYVGEGLLRKFYLDTEGREYTRGFAKEHELAGPYAAIIQGVTSPMSIEALEPTELLEIPVTTLRDGLVVGNGERRGRVLAERALVERDRREAWLLTCRPARRYVEVLRAMPWLEQRVAQRHIASYLGITPVSLSRIRARIR